eukprot:CAMPEP_0177688388 /NCGR_PEP_ID=MMETSP0447-20121125/34632_1 /TAXON_ID=0 /ORGANISM="Stygamoeba regulata, Strain BSH-02190019" /LENGTH=419 /DNA_ID=CAMNT_0019198687 /DNA_START=582 /DNA_END=1841 /DNA_ORIENTATION=+
MLTDRKHTQSDELECLRARLAELEQRLGLSTDRLALESSQKDAQLREKEELRLIEQYVYEADMQWDKRHLCIPAKKLFHHLFEIGVLEPNSRQHKSVLDKLVAALGAVAKRSRKSGNLLISWFSWIMSFLQLMRDEANFDIPPLERDGITKFSQISNADRSAAVASSASTSSGSSTAGTPVQSFQKELWSLLRWIADTYCEDTRETLSQSVISTMLSTEDSYGLFEPVKTNKAPGELVCDHLSDLMECMQQNHICEVITNQFLLVALASINAVVANSLFASSRRPAGSLCTPSVGFQVKLALSQLRNWMHENRPSLGELAISLLEVSNALASLLVTITNEQAFSTPAQVRELYQPLTFAQMLSVAQSFQPDRVSSDTVSAQVLKLLRDNAEACSAEELLLAPAWKIEDTTTRLKHASRQ